MTTTDTETPWVPLAPFGARLALLRQRMGWNVKEAAEACDLIPQSWRNWEDGKSCQKLYDVARKVSSRTGADERWLISGGPLRSRCDFVPVRRALPGIGTAVAA